jgi:hypothetical protein
MIPFVFDPSTCCVQELQSSDSLEHSIKLVGTVEAVDTPQGPLHNKKYIEKKEYRVAFK